MIRIPITVLVDVDPIGQRVYIDILDDASGVTLTQKIYLLDPLSGTTREVNDA